MLSYITVTGKENRNPNVAPALAAPALQQRQAVAAPALQPVNNDIVDLTGAGDEETNSAKAVAAPALQQRQAVAAPGDVIIIDVDSDLDDDAPLAFACKKAKVVVDDSQVGSEEHGTFKLQTLFLWIAVSLNLLTSHGNDCLGQFLWEMTSWARMAVAILTPSALPNSKEDWILSTCSTDSR